MNEEQLINDSYRKYASESIDIFFSLNVCKHFGNCIRGNSNVFDTKLKPWIITDGVSADVLY